MTHRPLPDPRKVIVSILAPYHIPRLVPPAYARILPKDIIRKLYSFLWDRHVMEEVEFSKIQAFMKNMEMEMFLLAMRSMESPDILH
jgi:hypothetical protein